MQKDGDLVIDQVEEWPGYAPTEVYHCAEKVLTPKHLSREEIEMLDRIAKKYGFLTGKQLEDLTHQEAPYVATEIQKLIPYELAYYRGTDFSDV